MKRLLLVLVGSLSLLPLTATYAASSPAPVGGIAVSPAIVQIMLTSGQSSASFNTEITNSNQSTVTIEVSTSDFTALNQSGSVAFLPNNSSNDVHGLAKSIVPGLKQFILAPHTSQTIPITIANTTTLAAGGHYGALIYKVLPGAVTSQLNQLKTHEEISTLVLLTTASGGTHSISLSQPNLNSLVFKLPTTINLVVSNTGNTQTAPVGVVTITKGANKEAARGIINVDSGLVLPSTLRLYQVALRTETSHNFPGFYKLHITYQASAASPVLSYTKSFVYISRPILVAVIIIVLIGLIIVIRISGPKSPKSKPKQTTKAKT